MAATSWKRAGNSAYLAAREITIRPDSIGSRSTSSQLREENARLKKLVIDLSLGKAILADVIKKVVEPSRRRGMSYQDIAGHVEELCGIRVSTATLSAITDKIIAEVKERQ